jgi:hypothetical protein
MDRIRGLLDKVKGRESDFVAKCPAHEDGNPSLSVSWKADRVLLHCHAGCPADAILHSLGLDWSDLFETQPDADRPAVVRSYLYENGKGEPWFWKDRYYPKDFRLRLPGTDPGDRHGLGGRPYVLYHLPRIYRAIRTGAIVWLVEGEKDVEAHERAGNIATTPPSSEWRPEYTAALKGVAGVVIVADQDAIKPDGSFGKGHKFAIQARDSLRAASIPVKVVRPAVGKDSTDHFNAGHTTDDFVMDRAVIIRPRGMTADDLVKAEFPVLNYAVEAILPEGLAMLAGSPKVGKSWVALDLSLGVAAGGRALSTLRTMQGSVLYLAREDGYRRLQSRLDLVMGGDEGEYLKYLEVVPSETEWVGGEVGLAAMTDWAEEVDNPRLVVLDTLGKVEPQLDEKDRYRSDYSMMAAYKTWADRHHLTVLMVHHDRKGTDDGGDVFNRISGTKGITGAADTLLFLDSKRGSHEGILHVTGRDVAEQEIELMKAGPLWQAATQPTAIHQRPRLVQ